MIERRELRLSVPSPGGDPWYMAGWLSLPEVPARNELQVLLHGATYDHRYWDWPVESEAYSYVRFAAEAGCATLAVDRIGSGASSRPPGRENTVRAQARALGRVVEDAKSGALVGHAFDRVVLVGHSFGSILAAAEAAWFGGVDAVVMIGLLGIGSSAQDDDPRADVAFQPVAQDAGVRHLTGLVDDAYLTMRAEFRVPLLYASDNCDPDVVALDERIKGVVTRGEVSDMGTAAAATKDIKVPTLVMVGEYDAMEADPDGDGDGDGDGSTYSAVRRAEGLAPEGFEFVVVPGVGHNINLHRDAPVAFRRIGAWLDSVSGH